MFTKFTVTQTSIKIKHLISSLRRLNHSGQNFVLLQFAVWLLGCCQACCYRVLGDGYATTLCFIVARIILVVAREFKACCNMVARVLLVAMEFWES